MKKAPCMLCGINTRSKSGAHGKCMNEYWDNVQMGMKKALIKNYQAYNVERDRVAAKLFDDCFDALNGEIENDGRIIFKTDQYPTAAEIRALNENA